MAESLTLLWYQTHSYAYMCPMEKMAFEENEHLAAFTEISKGGFSASFLRITCKSCVLQ